MTHLPQNPPVSVFCEHPQFAMLAPFSQRQITAILSTMLEHASDYTIAAAELALTNDQRIAILNKQYLGCQGPTNIITFPAGPSLPGSLYLSLDCLRREAIFFQQNIKTHFIRLLAHGTGHLAGLDHSQEMTNLETRLILAVQASMSASQN